MSIRFAVREGQLSAHAHQMMRRAYMMDSSLCETYTQLSKIKLWFKLSTLPLPMRRDEAASGCSVVPDARSAASEYSPSINSTLFACAEAWLSLRRVRQIAPDLCESERGKRCFASRRIFRETRKPELWTRTTRGSQTSETTSLALP